MKTKMAIYSKSINTNSKNSWYTDQQRRKRKNEIFEDGLVDESEK